MPSVVDKTMAILKLISDNGGEPVRVKSISAALGFDKATVVRILKALGNSGYVTRISRNEGYALGPEMYVLTRYGRYGGDIIDACRPLLKYLREKTGGTAIFAVLKNGKKYIIDHVEGGLKYNDSKAAIFCDDIYRTVTGRVILANLPLDEALDFFYKNGVPKNGNWDEVRDMDTYKRELRLIKSIKVLVSEDNSGRYIAFACPVFRKGICIGAVGLVLNRNSEFLQEYEKNRAMCRSYVLRVARETERRLAF